MAEQTTTSRPLREESEEEKRRREAAQNYLAGRSAYDKARSQGVDMTDVDYGKMSEADFKAEGLRRLDNIKSNFETAALAANKEGINSSKAAQDYLNRGQARIVGDTLVGSAAGISASEWEKRDKSGNYSLPTKNMVNFDRGVRMDQASYGNAIDSIDASNKQKADARPNYELAKQSVDRIAKERDAAAAVKAQASIDRYNKFREEVGAPKVVFGKEREDEKRIQDQAAAERKAASREYRSARAGLRNLQRSRSVGAADLQAATDRLTAAEDGLGPSRDAKDRQSYFVDMARKRLNPYEDPVASAPASISMTLGGTPDMSLSSDSPSPTSITLGGTPDLSLSADEDPEEAKRRKTGRRST